MDGNEVYYRIYLSHRTQKLIVVCMQSFDEYDYDQQRFYRGEDESPMRFETEEEALKFLNERFKPEFIDEECLTPNNSMFRLMEKSRTCLEN